MKKRLTATLCGALICVATPLAWGIPFASGSPVADPIAARGQTEQSGQTERPQSPDKGEKTGLALQPVMLAREGSSGGGSGGSSSGSSSSHGSSSSSGSSHSSSGPSASTAASHSESHSRGRDDTHADDNVSRSPATDRNETEVEREHAEPEHVNGDDRLGTRPDDPETESPEKIG